LIEYSNYLDMMGYPNDESLEIIIYRSFEFAKNYNFNYFSKKRKNYKNFNVIIGLKILKHYSKLITKSKNVKKLRAINRLYNYLFIFMEDIFKSMPKIIIAIYKSAIKLNSDLGALIEKSKDEKSKIENLKDEKSKIEKSKIEKLIRLKKYTKKNIAKMVNILNNAFKEPEILIRLPYEFFITIKNYNIFDVFKKCNKIWLEKQVANYLNSKYNIEIILMFFKKLNINIILYILEYLMLKGECIYELFYEKNNYNGCITTNDNLYSSTIFVIV